MPPEKEKVSKPSQSDAVVAQEEEKEQGEITVDLSPKKEEKPAEPKYVTIEDLEAIRKNLNANFYGQRKIESRLEEISRLVQGVAQPKTDQAKPVAVDEDEELLQKDWKAAVRKQAAAEYETLRKQEEARQKEYAAMQYQRDLLEKNKLKVIQKHPELQEATSDKARVYQEVINENPEYLTDPFGPVLAMRDMEDKLREKGFMDEGTLKAVEKETARISRTRATATTPPSRPASPDKIVLTKEQRELCEREGVPYEQYAKFYNLINKNGASQGVEA